MSDQRTFGWRGSLPWSSLVSLWQAARLPNRTNRDPQVNTLPLESEGFFGSTAGAPDASNLFHLSTQTFVNLLVTTLAPTAAVIVLGTTGYQPQQVPPPQVFTAQPPNLLTSTLDLPVSKVPRAPTVQQAKQYLWHNLDTSQGFTPPAAEAVAPPGQAAIGGAPQRLFQNVDTSRGLPPPVVVVAPPGQQSFLSASIRRELRQDNSRGFTPPAVAVAPPGQASFGAVPLRQWQLLDTSRGFTPQPLPPGKAALPGAVQLQGMPRESSRGFTPPVAVALPPGQASFPPVPQPAAMPGNTTQGFTPPIIAQALPPGTGNFPGVARHTQQPTDSSQSSYALLQPIVVQPLPPGSDQSFNPPYWAWSVTDTTAESPPVLIQGVQPEPPIPPVVGGGGPQFGTGGGKRELDRLFDEIDPYRKLVEKPQPGDPRTSPSMRGEILNAMDDEDEAVVLLLIQGLI